jgi:O-antigen/teichoic acid export membrane protein
LSDRYVITHALSLGQTALYVAAYQIGMVVQVFIGPIIFGFRPAASHLWDSGERAKLTRYIEHSLRAYSFFLIPSLFGLYHLGPPLLGVLAGRELVSSPYLSLLIALGVGSASINNITSYPVSLVRKNWIFLVLSIAAACFNLGFNIWLIPKWGIMAAAVSTLLTYWLRNAILTAISYRILPFRLDRWVLAKACISSVIMYGAIRWFSPVGLAAIAAVVLMGTAVYIASMITLRGITSQDWRTVSSAARSLLSRR